MEVNSAEVVSNSAHESLWELPDEVIAEILMEWVGIRSISGVDAACCSNSNRDRFLELVRADNFFVAQLIYCRNITSYYKWHALRRIKFRKFFMVCPVQVKTSVLKNLLSTVGPTTITSVDLRGRHSMEDTILRLLAQHCTAIEDVRVEFIQRGDISELFRVLETSCRTIATISLNDSQFAVPEGLSDFSLNKLTRLNLATKGSFQTLAPFCPTTCLTHMQMRSGAINDTGLEILSHHAGSLQDMAIFNCDMVTDAGMIRLAAACSELRVLRLSSCPFLSDAAVIPFLEKCPHLEALYLEGAFTDDTLLAIARNCGRRLRHLTLLEFRLTSREVGISALVQECTALVTLYCCFQPFMLPWVERLILAQSPALTEVHVNDMFVSNSTLDAIAEHGPHLRRLGLYYTTGLMPSALARLAQRCTVLETVYVEQDDEGETTLSQAVRAFWQVIRPGLKFVDDVSGPEYWRMDMGP